MLLVVVTTQFCFDSLVLVLLNYVHRLASNSEITCLCFPSTEVKGVHQQDTQPKSLVFEAGLTM